MTRDDLTNAALATHTNFEDVFEDGAVFDGSGVSGEANEEVTISVSDAGTLNLPSGRILAGEPWSLSELDPFTTVVRPGEYPVLVSSIEGHTNVASMVRFSDSPVTRWEMATRPGEQVDDLPPGQIFAYDVDGGLGGFADAEAVARLDRDSNWWDSVVPLIDSQISNTTGHETYFELLLDEATGAKIIAFNSGYGDGAYASYWGLDEAGQPARLATDFGVLVTNQEDSLVIDNPSAKLDEPLAVEAMVRVGRLNVHLSPNPDGGWYLTHEGVEGLQGQVVDENGTVYADTMLGGKRVTGGARPSFRQTLNCSESELANARLVLRFGVGVRPSRRIR